MSETKTISLAGSDELYWEDVEDYSKNKGFTTTSGFIQYLLEKEILGLKTKFKDKITYIMLLLMIAMMTMMLMLIFW